jgi:hypothetical protein
LGSLLCDCGGDREEDSGADGACAGEGGGHGFYISQGL